MKLNDLLIYNDSEVIRKIFDKARGVYLDVIDYNKKYNVTKESVINKSPNGIPDEGSIITDATVCISGNPENVVLEFFGNGCLKGPNSYLRTSVIENCLKVNETYLVETLNSVYRLTPVVSDECKN